VPEVAAVSLEADFGQAGHRRPDLQTGYVEPADDVERTVAGVWRELLGYDRVGTADNFYALGGSSLLTARLVTRLRERYDVDLAPEQFLVADTVGAQATIVRDLLGADRSGG
jgi:acyl carrier protein